jgi:hypothetical protein
VKGILKRYKNVMSKIRPKPHKIRTNLTTAIDINKT